MKYAIILLFILLPTLVGSAHWYEIVLMPTFDLPEITVKPINQLDLELLARLVDSEDRGQGFESNLVNAQTVVYKASKYGSIEKAVYKKYVSKSGKVSYAYYGRFNKVWKKNQPEGHTRLACEMVLKGYRPAPEGIGYFIGKNDPDSKWVRKIRRHSWKKIGYHTYCFDPNYKQHNENELDFKHIP